MPWITCINFQLVFFFSTNEKKKASSFLFHNFENRNAAAKKERWKWCWPAYRIIQTTEKSNERTRERMYNVRHSHILCTRSLLSTQNESLGSASCEQWIKKCINWNTIAVVYAFKLVYNKQTIAYFQNDSYALHAHYIFFLQRNWRYYSHHIWAHVPICLCLSQFISYFTWCTENELHCSRATRERDE